MKKLFLLVAMVLSTQTVAASYAPYKLEGRRVINISGVIKNTQRISDRLLELSEVAAPVTILIDSNGGSVIGGLQFIRAMDRAKSRGVVLNCVVTGHAMSMAMHILGNCQKRFALPTSLLMWHPAYVSGFIILTEDRARQYGDQLRLLTEYLEKRLKKALGLKESTYNRHYKGEYIMLAADLKKLTPKFITLVSDIRRK